MQRQANGSRENFSTRILLDTTYLLPIFGVDIGLEQFDSKFPKIVEEFEVLYNQASFIEVKWTVLSLLKKEKQREKKQEVLETYIEGLEALAGPEQRLKSISTLTLAQAERIADYILFKFGVRDYFDRLIYASAAVNKAILLTQDRGLIEIQEKRANRPEENLGSVMGQDEFIDVSATKPVDIISWNELLRKFRI